MANKLHIAFEKGVDTKTDPYLVAAPSLLTCYNGVLVKAGTWTKRNGATLLSKAILGGGSITSAQSLAVFDKELLLFTGGLGYSWAPTAGTWIPKGSLTPVTLTEDTVIRNGYIQSNPDADSVLGITMFAWEDTRGGVYLRVVDETSGALYIADQLVSATGARPKVVALTDRLCLLYADGANLKFVSVLVSAPSTVTGAVTVDTNVSATPCIDAVAALGGSAIIAAWSDNTPAHTRLAYVTNAGVLGSGATGYPNEINIVTSSVQAVSVVYDPTNLLVWVGMANGANFTAAAYTSGGFVAVVAPVLIDNATTVKNVVGVVAGTTCTWYYEITAAATYNSLIETNTLTIAGAVGAKAVYQRSVGLASKPFVYGGSVYLWAAFQSFLQATMFLLRLDVGAPTIMAKGQPGGSNGLYTAGVLPRAYSPGAGRWTVATVVREQLVNTVTVNTSGVATATIPSSGVPTAITSYYLAGVDRLDVTFVNPNQYQSVQLSENLHLTGGFLTAYDGQGFVEHGFHLYPENVTAVASGAGGSMATDTYQFIVVYYWQDAKGLIHRSAPSTPLQVAVTGPTGSVALTIPTLRLTAKQGARSPVQIAVFRASTANQTFFRIGNGAADPVTAPVYNSTSADTVAFSSTVADASILANEPLYTTGNVLENLAPPAASMIAQSSNRLFLAGVVDEPCTVYYSKPNVSGRPVEFSGPFLTLQVPSDGGPITNISVMEGIVLVFKANQTWAFSGQGPDATGSTVSNTFSLPTLVTSDVGSSSPTSTVTTRDGLMFMTPKGIYTLTRGLAADYTGWQVEAYNSNACSSGQMIAGTNQIRFTFSNGDALVYDYVFKEWSVNTNQVAVDAVNWNGIWTYAKADGSVYVEAPGVFTDGNVPIQMFLETAWIKTAGLQGFQSIVEGHFLGAFYAPHQMVVGIAYNYAPTNAELKVWQPNTVLNAGAVYGADVYGATTYGGVISVVNQFRFKPKIHKCEAIKFQFYDQGGNGKGYSVSGLDLTWIPLEKNFPLPSGQTL